MTYTDDTIMDVEARTASDESQTPPDKQKVAQEALDNPVGKGASNLVCEATNHDEDKDAALGAHADLCGAVAVVPPNASAALACNDTTVIIGNTPGHAVRPVVTQASNPSERTTPPSFGWEVSSLSAPTLRFGSGASPPPPKFRFGSGKPARQTQDCTRARTDFSGMMGPTSDKLPPQAFQFGSAALTRAASPSQPTCSALAGPPFGLESKGPTAETQGGTRALTELSCALKLASAENSERQLDSARTRDKLGKAISLLDAHLEREHDLQHQQAETQRNIDALVANMSKIASMVRVMESRNEAWKAQDAGAMAGAVESRIQAWIQESPVSVMDRPDRSEAPHSGPEDAGQHSGVSKQLFPQGSDLEMEVQVNDMPAWLREAEEQIAAERVLLVADASRTAELALAEKRQAGLQLAAKRAANRRAAARYAREQAEEAAGRGAVLSSERQAGLQLAAKRAANRRAAARCAREQAEGAEGCGAVLSSKQQRHNERAVRAVQLALRRKAAVTQLQAEWRRAMARAVAEQLRRAHAPSAGATQVEGEAADANAGAARGNAICRELQRWYSTVCGGP